MAKKRIVIGTNLKVENKLKELLRKLLLSNIESLLKDNEIKKRLESGVKPKEIYRQYLNSFKDEEVSDLEAQLQELFFLLLSDLNNLMGLGGRGFNKGEREFINEVVKDSLLYIESILLDQHKELSRILSDAVIYGKTIPQIKKDIQNIADITAKRAETIAITQTAKANSHLAQSKLKSFGVVNVIWSSAKDKRVRKCHLARDGKKYPIAKGCYSSCDGKTIHTGFEVRCRCAMIAIF